MNGCQIFTMLWRFFIFTLLASIDCGMLKDQMNSLTSTPKSARLLLEQNEKTKLPTTSSSSPTSYHGAKSRTVTNDHSLQYLSNAEDPSLSSQFSPHQRQRSQEYHRISASPPLESTSNVNRPKLYQHVVLHQHFITNFLSIIHTHDGQTIRTPSNALLTLSTPGIVPLPDTLDSRPLVLDSPSLVPRRGSNIQKDRKVRQDEPHQSKLSSNEKTSHPGKLLENNPKSSMDDQAQTRDNKQHQVIRADGSDARDPVKEQGQNYSDENDNHFLFPELNESTSSETNGFPQLSSTWKGKDNNIPAIYDKQPPQKEVNAGKNASTIKTKYNQQHEVISADRPTAPDPSKDQGQSDSDKNDNASPPPGLNKSMSSVIIKSQPSSSKSLSDQLSDTTAWRGKNDNNLNIFAKQPPPKAENARKNVSAIKTKHHKQYQVRRKNGSNARNNLQYQSQNTIVEKNDDSRQASSVGNKSAPSVETDLSPKATSEVPATLPTPPTHVETSSTEHLVNVLKSPQDIKDEATSNEKIELAEGSETLSNNRNEPATNVKNDTIDRKNKANDQSNQIESDKSSSKAIKERKQLKEVQNITDETVKEVSRTRGQAKKDLSRGGGTQKSTISSLSTQDSEYLQQSPRIDHGKTSLEMHSLNLQVTEDIKTRNRKTSKVDQVSTTLPGNRNDLAIDVKNDAIGRRNEKKGQSKSQTSGEKSVQSIQTVIEERNSSKKKAQVTLVEEDPSAKLVTNVFEKMKEIKLARFKKMRQAFATEIDLAFNPNQHEPKNMITTKLTKVIQDDFEGLEGGRGARRKLSEFDVHELLQNHLLISHNDLYVSLPPMDFELYKKLQHVWYFQPEIIHDIPELFPSRQNEIEFYRRLATLIRQIEDLTIYQNLTLGVKQTLQLKNITLEQRQSCAEVLKLGEAYLSQKGIFEITHKIKYPTSRAHDYQEQLELASFVGKPAATKLAHLRQGTFSSLLKALSSKKLNHSTQDKKKTLGECHQRKAGEGLIALSVVSIFELHHSTPRSFRQRPLDDGEKKYLHNVFWAEKMVPWHQTSTRHWLCEEFKNYESRASKYFQHIDMQEAKSRETAEFRRQVESLTESKLQKEVDSPKQGKSEKQAELQTNAKTPEGTKPQTGISIEQALLSNPGDSLKFSEWGLSTTLLKCMFMLWKAGWKDGINNLDLERINDASSLNLSRGNWIELSQWFQNNSK